LTCRETLRYAAELYDIAAGNDLELLIDEIVKKMGLQGCVDTRNAELSGGQRRRLSIGIALLKQPTLIFFDEPTTGTTRKRCLIPIHYVLFVYRFDFDIWA
jgi:ABC-type multidrug transport system ATPase subunit